MERSQWTAVPVTTAGASAASARSKQASIGSRAKPATVFVSSIGGGTDPPTIGSAGGSVNPENLDGLDGLDVLTGWSVVLIVWSEPHIQAPMKNRTIHPAEFAGWRPSMVDAALWETILWAGVDDNGDPLERSYDMSAAWREDMERLSQEFYDWKDKADDVMIANGCGHLTLEELLGGDRVEHVYVLVRDGHGVSMTDDWIQGKERRCCAALERLAQAQGPIGAYPGDDGRIYLSFSV